MSLAIPQSGDGLVAWLHIGDTHLTEGAGESFHALQEAVVEANLRFNGGVDFIYHPGDVAEHGAAKEYALAIEALAWRKLPLFVVPGDHDMHPRNTDAFREAFPLALPHAEEIAGRRCLFVDVVSQGTGGPDFRLGSAQLDWLKRQLESAKRGAILFMHVYPDDLADPGERDALLALLARHHVIAVDMGHTHYNELSNDGRTIFAATRSLGQIEEGPPGVSIAAVDEKGAFSWRFKPLGEAWPWPMIVAPADRRLVVEDANKVSAPRRGESFDVRALGLPAEKVVACRFRIDDNEWREMSRMSSRLWSGRAEAPDRPFRLTVEARDASDETGLDEIEIAPLEDHAPPERNRRGSDADALEAWPDRHLFATQLGPNRNGKKW